MSDAATLADAVVSFCAYLRAEHGFALGTGETHDALRALDVAGVDDAQRVRVAMRLICCASRDEVGVFDPAFDAFFLDPRKGIAQDSYRPRHSRPPKPQEVPAEERPAQGRDHDPEDAEHAHGASRNASPQSLNELADSWQALLAKYSAAAARRDPPAVAREGLDAMLDAAGRFVSRMRLGRSRRWRVSSRGGRIDVRATLRASLQTGGEPGHLRWLDHPPRNPSFVVLIDGSRSMTEYGAQALQFAYALRRRCRRTSVFAFSTSLREITRELSVPVMGAALPLGDLGEAWGGGTRIGHSLATFARTFAARLDEDAIVFVLSDGLDVGDIEQLRAALRSLARRSARVVWLNPLLAVAGYEPISAGMRAARPHVLLHALDGPHSFDLPRSL